MNYIQCKINTNFFISFFENEVIAGVEYFAKKLVTLFSALLSKSAQVEFMTIKLFNIGQLLRDYFDVSYSTIQLIYDRLQYRVELGSDTQFHCHDLCKILIEYYVCIQKIIESPQDYQSFGFCSQDSNSSYNCPGKVINFKEIVAKCLNLVIQLNCYDDSDKIEEGQRIHLGHVQSQQELQNIFYQLYIRAFKSLEEQHIVVDLMAQLISLNAEKGLIRKNLVHVLFRPMKKNDDEFEHYTKQGDLGFMLDNNVELTCFQNLMHSTLFTYNLALRQTFYRLLRTLLNTFDHEIIYQIFKIFEVIVKTHHTRIKSLVQKEDKDLYNKKKFDWIQRLLFMVQSLEFCIQQPGFGYIFNFEHLVEEVIKIFKLSEDEIEYVEYNEASPRYHLLLLSLRLHFFKLFSKIVDHENGIGNIIEPNSKACQFLIEDIPHITYQQAIFKQMQATLQKEVNLDKLQIDLENSLEYKKNTFYILGMTQCLQVLRNSSKNIVGQIIVLYSDYSETVFKAKPIITLPSLVELLIRVVSQLARKEELQSNYDVKVQILLINFINAFVQFMLRVSFQPLQKVVHNGDVRRRALNALLFEKRVSSTKEIITEIPFQNITEFWAWLSDSLKKIEIQELNSSFIIATYLLGKFQTVSSSTSTNDDRDMNIALPSEPRRHEKIFELYDIYRKKINVKTVSRDFLYPMSKFFYDNVLEIEGQRSFLKYSSLTLSLVTPWFKAFQDKEKSTKQPLQTDLQIPNGFDFEEDIFEFVEFKIEDYPKPFINDILTLVDRQTTQFRERKGILKHLNVRVVEQFDPYERRVQQQPYFPPKMQDPQKNYMPPQFPVGQTPAIPRRHDFEEPMRAGSFLDDLRPITRTASQPTPIPFVNKPLEEDPRLVRQNQQQQGQVQQPLQQPSQQQQQPLGQQGYQQTMPMQMNLQYSQAIRPPQMSAYQQPLIQQQQMQPQLQQQQGQMLQQQPQQHFQYHQQQPQQQQQQVPLQQLQVPQQLIQQPQQNTQQQFLQQQFQQSQQQFPQQQPMPQSTQAQQKLGDEQKQEITEIIASLTEEEKTILKSYLASSDPRREKQLRDFQKKYPGINRFIQTVKRQQSQ